MMRNTTIAMACAALTLGSVAYAQAPTARPPSSGAQTPAPNIRNVTVVDIDELPVATQSQVKASVAQKSEADLQQIRDSVDATPQAASALKAKGMTSAQVVAINLDRNGTLMLVTNKKAG